MAYSIAFDVAGPGLLVAAGASLLALFIITLIIIGLESVILWRLRWGVFKRALLAGFAANSVSSILGIGVVPFTLEMGYWGLLVDFALSVLMEGCILILFKRSAARENWSAALVMNFASYLLVILPLYLLSGLLG